MTRSTTKGATAFARREFVAAAGSSGETENAVAIPREHRLGLIATVATGFWFGLVAGPLEVAAILIRDAIDPRIMPELLRVNRNWIWMAPLANLAIFAAATAIASLIVAIRPRSTLVLRWVVFGYCFLTILPVAFAIQGMYIPAYLAITAGVAAFLARRIRERSTEFGRVVTLSLPVLIAFDAIFIGITYRRVQTAEEIAAASLPPAKPASPNVLLIVLDTVRADALGSYGYNRDTTPNLDRLARRGVRFEQARATADWTLPSHASIFTGKWAFETGANVGAALDRSIPTLAELLSSEGYATGGFAGNAFYCNARFGLDRGFVRYYDYAENRKISTFEILKSNGILFRLFDLALWWGVAIPGGNCEGRFADTVDREALDWLSSPRRDGRPFFAFLNYTDAHDPFLLPEGNSYQFVSEPVSESDKAMLKNWFDIPKSQLSDRELELARDAYDDCIAYMDKQLGIYLEELERRGELKNTAIVIAGDHGEMWGEHQVYGHSKSLYRGETRVPLIIVAPERGVPAGRVVADPVSLRDIPATVVDLLGLEDRSPFPGRSLARFWKPKDPNALPEEDPILTEVSIRERNLDFESCPPAWQGPMKSLIADGKVYIRNSDGREELYDLAADPLEERDLSALPSSRAAIVKFRTQLEQITKHQ